jgi:HK97 family phage major capsid protein
MEDLSMRFIADLVHEKKQLVEKAEAILNEAEKAGGSLTKEQERLFNRYKDRIMTINDSIDEELSKIRTSEPILNTPYNPMAREDVSITPITKAISKTFRGMFYGNETVKLSNNGFHSMDEFLRTLHSGRADNRLINTSMVEGIPEFGGYSVPEEYGAFLMDKSLENEIIRPRATVWAMGSETKKVPAFDGANRTNHLFGGISQENGWRKGKQAPEKPPS